MRKVHWYYKFLIVFLLFFSMFFFLNRNISYFINESNYKGITTKMMIPFNYINKYNLFNYKDFVRENNRLKKQILLGNVNTDINKNLVKEIEILKKTMDLEKTYTGYKMVYAKTIIRNKMYWYNTITLDKGSRDGIEKNQAVVGKDGLIGIIKDTTKSTSTVKLITNNDVNSKVSGMVKIDKDTKIGLIEGYEAPYLKVSVTDSKGIKEGDSFYTSGLSNLPKNIYIGSVKKIEKDSLNLSDILYVEPKQDMNDIDYVVVLGN